MLRPQYCGIHAEFSLALALYHHLCGREGANVGSDSDLRRSMNRSLNYIVASLLVHICLLGTASPQEAEKKPSVGRLVVAVAYPDDNHTPAKSAYVAVQGYPWTVHYSGSTTVLTQTDPGHYEAMLPAGIYDIQVSEAQSYPQCKRIEIVPGKKEFWDVKLETDFPHLEN